MKKQRLSGSIIIETKADTFRIFQVDATPNETKNVFGVTSKRGYDTVGNGLVFPSIQKAIAYVNYAIKNNG